MRETKFRGMTTKGEMITGSLVVTDRFIKNMERCHTKTWIVESAFGNGGWFNVTRRQYVKPETVGQYTGLKDRNGTGNEMCQGDIVFAAGLGFGVVNKNRWGEWGLVINDGFESIHDLMMECDLGSIIGNIHENHELLEREA